MFLCKIFFLRIFFIKIFFNIFEIFDHFLKFFMITTIFSQKYIKLVHENIILIKKSLILIIFWKNFACGAKKPKNLRYSGYIVSSYHLIVIWPWGLSHLRTEMIHMGRSKSIFTVRGSPSGYVGRANHLTTASSTNFRVTRQQTRKNFSIIPYNDLPFTCGGRNGGGSV